MNENIRGDHPMYEKNGHIILLMESKQDQRTFSDYPDLHSCLDEILSMYEGIRVERNEDKDNYTLETLWSWLGEWHRIEMYKFDAEISRYKKIKYNDFKQLFVEAIK